jgi:hypothetical protein
MSEQTDQKLDEILEVLARIEQSLLVIKESQPVVGSFGTSEMPRS